MYRLYQTLTVKPNHNRALTKSHALMQILREMTRKSVVESNAKMYKKISTNPPSPK